MPRASHKGVRFDAFFKSLRASILEAWTSPEGFAYDRVQYAVRYPYKKGDMAAILRWAGRPGDEGSLPALKKLNEALTNSLYPELAFQAPKGLSVEGWSAILHFLDPSYPLATARANRALRALGFALPEALTLASYPAYVEALDALKERAPVWSVPETNWYLARVIEVGLEAFPAAVASGRGASARANS